jgi:hypothetical protein
MGNKYKRQDRYFTKIWFSLLFDVNLYNIVFS